jgi:uncharacterized membrane protein
MALDHCSFFAKVNVVAETYADRAVSLPSTPWFAVGLLTNPSAPLFWFLGGLSVSLIASRHRQRTGSLAPAVRYLLVRATLLLLLDLVVIPALWVDWHHFRYDYDFGLLSSLAVGLALAAALLPWPVWALGALGALLALAQPALVALTRPLLASAPLVVRMWAAYGSQTEPRVVFPVLGWLPVLVGGMAVGRAFAGGAWRRSRDWAIAGCVVLAACVLARLTGFGDFSTHPAGPAWRDALVMSKGPPGLDYLGFNLGIGLLALALLWRPGLRFDRGPLRWLVIFGQASLFFFVAHLLLFRFIETPLRHLLPNSGTARYLLGLAIGMPLLLPMTRAYRQLKEMHPRSVLRYL